MKIEIRDDTLCIKCDNYRNCSWRWNLIPEQGWTALKLPYDKTNGVDHTYHVFKCPKFKRGCNYENEYTEKTDETKTQWDAFAEICTMVNSSNMDEEHKKKIHEIILDMNSSICNTIAAERKKTAQSEEARLNEKREKEEMKQMLKTARELFSDTYFELHKGQKDAKRRAKEEFEKSMENVDKNRKI